MLLVLSNLCVAANPAAGMASKRGVVALVWVWGKDFRSSDACHVGLAVVED